MTESTLPVSRFQTLLLREWMQHHRGWLIMLGAPLVIAALLLIFGSVHFGDSEAGPRTSPNPSATALAMIAMVATQGVLLAIAWLMLVLQLTGLARRDQQDRSIEFWLSLPIGHAQSLSATLLMHLLVVPCFALAVGLLVGPVMAMLLVIKVHGVSALWSLPWPSLVLAAAVVALRLALGTALALLWLSPLLLGAMAASAWLKRWGLPAMIGGIAMLGLWAEKVYGSRVVWETLTELLFEAGYAMLSTVARGHNFRFDPRDEGSAALGELPAWAGTDALASLQALASPLLLGALIVAGGCFMLLILRRQRGA